MSVSMCCVLLLLAAGGAAEGINGTIEKGGCCWPIAIWYECDGGIIMELNARE